MLQTNDNTGVIGIYREGNALDVYIESGSHETISLRSYHAKVPGWGWHTSNILSEWEVIHHKNEHLTNVSEEIYIRRNGAMFYEEIRVTKPKLDIFATELNRLIAEQEVMDYDNEGKVRNALEKIGKTINFPTHSFCFIL